MSFCNIQFSYRVNSFYKLHVLLNALEENTRILTIITFTAVSRMSVSCDSTHLHYIFPNQFVDSIEWEASKEQQEAKEFFQVRLGDNPVKFRLLRAFIFFIFVYYVHLFFYFRLLRAFNFLFSFITCIYFFIFVYYVHLFFYFRLLRSFIFQCYYYFNRRIFRCRFLIYNQLSAVI